MSFSERTVADLITEIDESRLDLKPFFQRRLVWTSRDKEYFIDTVLKGLPFPEIFIATDKIDAEKVRVKNWLVDGRQRITNLHDYVRGTADLLYKTVVPFSKLEDSEQQKFLHYKVAVRDLGNISVPAIKEIFNRINSTDYSLKKMEILNALYSGEYKRYCMELAENDFFINNKVFRKGGEKRMSDVTFCVILVTTIQCGYYRRDEKNEEYLSRYNDEFPDKDKMQSGLDRVFDFIEQCKFTSKCRIWRQTDLFTILVELHSALIIRKVHLVPNTTGELLAKFYDHVDAAFKDKSTKTDISTPYNAEDVNKYLKAGTKATNDKYARVDRAEIISKLLLHVSQAEAHTAPRHSRKKT